MGRLTELKGKEVKAGAASAKNMKMLAKGGAAAGAVFAVLFSIAQKFAASADAIGAGVGSLNVTSDEVKHNLMDAEIASIGIGATMQDVVAVTNAVAGEFGVSSTEASKMSAQLLDTAKAVGMSNEEAAKLSGILQTTSGLSAEQAEELTEGAYQLAQANNVAPKAVMQDLAASAEEFASFSKDGGDNLVQAAIQARALGLSLQDTAKISEGLLNFQDPDLMSRHKLYARGLYGEGEENSKFVICPAGSLLVFPSDLIHRVDEHMLDTPRISVSSNLLSKY
mgnify:CR=1 FL=1